MFINIYKTMESYIIKLFDTREEADASKTIEHQYEKKHENGAKTQITNYCSRVSCLELSEYILRDHERDAILHKAEKCKKNKRMYASLMHEYNNFWFILGK